MFYAIGEVKLAYNAYYGNLSDDYLKAHVCGDVFDFSILHELLDKNYISSLKAFLSGEDKLLSSLVVSLNFLILNI